MADLLRAEDYPPVTVGVIGADLSRYSWFTQSLRALWLPPGSQIVFCNGLWIAKALNTLMADMRPQDEAFLFALTIMSSRQIRPEIARP